jgi:hypothetical protein
MRKRVDADNELWLEVIAARRDFVKLLEHPRQREGDAWQQIGNIAMNIVRRIGDTR